MLLVGGRALSGMASPALRIFCRYTSIVLFAWSRITFSLSNSSGHENGRIRIAQSSSLKHSTVAASAIRAAFLAWTNGSRNDRENAAIKTLALVEPLRCLASFPRQMVVFVRIPGCSSFPNLARYLSSSPLMVRSDSFVTIVRTDFSVCSRTRGARSVNPVTYVGKIRT